MISLALMASRHWGGLSYPEMTPPSIATIFETRPSCTVRFQGPPRLFWLISALLVGLFWSLAALRHTLLQSNGFDLGIYDQVAWQMSQGLEPRSTLFGLHHMGNYGAWVFYTIGSLCRLVPTVHWLFFTQALGLNSHSLAPVAPVAPGGGHRRA